LRRSLRRLRCERQGWDMENAPLTLALVLIAVGLVLLIAELFIPTGGILFAFGIGAIVIGVAIPFFYGDTQTGVLTMMGVFIAVPTIISLMFHLGPKTPIGRRLMKSGPDEDATVATMPVNLELEQLRGRFGRAISALRPAGTVDFDGRRIDVLTEGTMVEPGAWVRCVEVKAARVIVRPVDKPDLGSLENADFG
jgi:membrane-bound ClpP family serine protease